MRHGNRKTCQVHAAEMPREEWFGLVLANHATMFGSRQTEEGRQSFFLLGNSWGKLVTWIVGSTCKTTTNKTDLRLVSNSLYFTCCHLDLLFATLVQRCSHVLCCSAFTSMHATWSSSFVAAAACTWYYSGSERAASGEHGAVRAQRTSRVNTELAALRGTPSSLPCWWRERIVRACTYLTSVDAFKYKGVCGVLPRSSRKSKATQMQKRR